MRPPRRWENFLCSKCAPICDRLSEPMAKKQKPPWEKKSNPQPLDLESEVTQITSLPTSLAEELEGDGDDRLFRNTPTFFEQNKKWLALVGGLFLLVLVGLLWPREKPLNQKPAPVSIAQPTVVPETPVIASPTLTLPPPASEPAIRQPQPQPPIQEKQPKRVSRTVSPPARPKVSTQAKVKAVARPATITIEAQPWAIVYIDGKRLNRITPIRALELPEGRHRLRLENPQSKKRVEKDIRLKAGQALTLKFQMR